jgi:hypothetical protein
MPKRLTLAAAAAFALTAVGVVPAHASSAASSPHQVPHSRGMHRCNPPSVDTVTSLVLKKTTVHRGDGDSATVEVGSAGSLDPQGIVELAIYQANSGTGATKNLNAGQARFSLPQDLDVGRYKVRASYLPGDCTKWRKSRSGVEHLTVLPAG